MKVYSADSITRPEVENIARDINEKQTRQIKQLRIWLAVSFVANVVLTLGLRFL